MIITALTIIAILVVLIIFHEFGHFSVAKLFNIKVEEFGLGFPPKIASFTKGETKYTLNSIPAGGFVKIYGEDGEGGDDPRSFSYQKAYVRFLVIVAGVTMNFVLAGLLFSFAIYAGMPAGVSDDDLATGVKVQAQIVDIAQDSPAFEAGVKRGDIIRGFKEGDNNYFISNIDEVQDYTVEHKGKNVILLTMRGDKEIETEIFLRDDRPEGEGAMGVSLVNTRIVSYSLPAAFVEGFKTLFSMAVKMIIMFFIFFKGLFSGSGMAGQIGGPVKIAQMTAEVVPLGIAYVFNFAAILSLTLAIINIMPLPALDGGRIVFILIEKIKGKPISQKIESTIHNVGFAVLMFLLIIITYNDISGLIK